MYVFVRNPAMDSSPFGAAGDLFSSTLFVRWSVGSVWLVSFWTWSRVWSFAFGFLVSVSAVPRVVFRAFAASVLYLR